jgi:hypothetical protein
MNIFFNFFFKSALLLSSAKTILLWLLRILVSFSFPGFSGLIKLIIKIPNSVSVLILSKLHGKKTENRNRYRGFLLFNNRKSRFL